MKLRILSLALVMTSLISCSSDDTSINDTNNATYFPLSVGNKWNYINSSTAEGEVENTNEETLTLTAENNNAYSFSSSANMLERGVITGILVNGNLTKQNEKLIYNGQYEVELSSFGIENLSIPIDNLVVYDVNASAGDALSTISNTINQTLNLQGQDIPLSMTYALHTVQNEILESYTVNNTSYENVLKANVSLNLAVDASLVIVTVPLLEEQEVLTSSNYYAADIGLIYSENSASYNFEDLSQFGIPNIDSVNVDSSQSIDTYTIQ
ncbi:hypothetical protein ACFQ3R_01455 [Mesonia ostreae]|uniref:Lipoprotein n=1 Tax=Mesonia ostreae TaxID=861110 RepID=A0ABU2KI45_9FLAO|nr:hypothetical protein [Mesonia ostreae]MDT0294349.1 hypothetical protein [Mesonia ostreae]